MLEVSVAEWVDSLRSTHMVILNVTPSSSSLTNEIYFSKYLTSMFINTENLCSSSAVEMETFNQCRCRSVWPFCRPYCIILTALTVLLLITCIARRISVHFVCTANLYFTDMFVVAIRALLGFYDLTFSFNEQDRPVFSPRPDPRTGSRLVVTLGFCFFRL